MPLRDRAAARTLDLVVITAPDRLARNYVHQVLLLEELEGHGCEVRFLDRPMGHDPHDQCCCRSAARSRSMSAR
jgi:site-specific DNA recombinase